MKGSAANRNLKFSKRRGNHKRVVRLQPNSDAVDVSANRTQEQPLCQKKLPLADTLFQSTNITTNGDFDISGI